MSQIIADTLKLIADNQDVILSAVRLAATNKKITMREIKFRAKRLDNGEWVNGFVLFNQDKSEAVIAKLTPTESVCENVIPDTIGQFTGLHDKNGTEIYEGDILRDPHSGEVVVVEWCTTWLQYILSKCNSPNKRGLPFFVALGYAVVGNIHDNPYLDID